MSGSRSPDPIYELRSGDQWVTDDLCDGWVASSVMMYETANDSDGCRSRDIHSHPSPPPTSHIYSLCAMHSRARSTEDDFSPTGESYRTFCPASPNPSIPLKHSPVPSREIATPTTQANNSSMWHCFTIYTTNTSISVKLKITGYCSLYLVTIAVFQNGTQETADDM